MVVITAFYASLLAIAYVALSYNVTRYRRHQKVAIMDQGGDETLRRVIRAHGNFAEYVPFLLLMMALYELLQGSAWVLHILGIAIIISRALHAWSILMLERTGTYKVRVVAMAITFTAFLILAVLMLMKTVPVLLTPGI